MCIDEKEEREEGGRGGRKRKEEGRDAFKTSTHTPRRGGKKIRGVPSYNKKLSLRRAHHSKRVAFYRFDFQMVGHCTRFALI